MSQAVRIIPLGGLGEIGKNMTVYETEGGSVLVDAGLAFPRDEHLGVDLVLPDFSYLKDHAGDLHAVLLTHAHEDHVGSLPYVLREVPVPRVLAGSPEPVPFGRVASNEIRVAVIERDRTVPARELFDRIATDIARYRRRLTQLSEAELSRRGLHPTRGDLAIPAILERFVTGHLEDHVEQLRASLRTG